MRKNGKPPLTEADLLALLDVRVEKEGPNGPAAVVLHHVRSAAGFAARRTLDAVSMGFYPSRGLHLHGYEVKTSRSDWLRELKDPAKAEEFAGLVDFLTVVTVPDVVVDGELPLHWGLLVVQGGRLVEKSSPTYLHADELGPLTGNRRGRTPLPPALGRSFLACLLRQASRRAAVVPEEIQAAVNEALAADRVRTECKVADLQGRAERAETIIRDFEKSAQVRLGDRWGYGKDPEEVGRVLRMVLDGDRRVEQIERRLEQLAETAEGIRAEVEQHVALYREQLEQDVAA